jgi:hypothetical protein
MAFMTGHAAGLPAVSRPVALLFPRIHPMRSAARSWLPMGDSFQKFFD